MPSILRAGRYGAPSMSPRMPEPPSTASTCFNSPRIASRRSIRRPAVCSPPSRRREIHQVDPETGAILRIVESSRFVTGVTWVDGDLWHATWEGEESDVRRVDPGTGEVLERLEMPPGMGVSGLESDGGDRFFCGGGKSGKVRAVRRPKRGSGKGSGSKIL